MLIDLIDTAPYVVDYSYLRPGHLGRIIVLLDAVSDGTVECGSGAAHYWAGKVPAAHWFSAVPFGFKPQGFNAWLYGGGGLQLGGWEAVSEFAYHSHVAGAYR